MALAALSKMDEHGVVPSVHVYRCLLHACMRKKALAHARQVQAHVAKLRLESNPMLDEFLVRALINCGGLEYALQVFHRLHRRSVVCWTSVITAHAVAGRAQEALRMYEMMLDEGVQPDAYTFVSLLKACSNLTDLREGKRIHCEAIRHRCEFSPFVGTCLVHMYARCGSIIDAQAAFNVLSQRDCVCWTVMIAAYAQLEGQAEKALLLYEQMREEAVSPDHRTIVSVLQACGFLAEAERDSEWQSQFTKAKWLQIGKALHAEAQRKAYGSFNFVNNSLLSMYGKCGSILDAQFLFDQMGHHDIVSWNAILAAYVHQCQEEKALLMYERMQEEGMLPDARTFVTSLQACGLLAEKEGDDQPANLKFLEKAKALHAQAGLMGYSANVFIENSLVSIYAKCGSTLDAQNVFNGSLHPDIVSWNSMLTGYAQQHQADKALELYVRMQEEGVSPNIGTFMCVLQACGFLAEKDEDGQSAKLACLERGKAVHAYVRQKSYNVDVFVGSIIIIVYGKCGSIVDSEHVFDNLPHKDVTLWNAMLTAYVHRGQADKALQLYGQMQEEGVSADDRTFVSALQACSLLAAREKNNFVDWQATTLTSLEKGRAIHKSASEKGYASNVFIGSSLICMYGKCGSLVDAQSVFDGLPLESVVAWNSMLSAYVERGEGEKAFKLYAQMQKRGMCPNDITLVCILQACGNTGNLGMCRMIHQVLLATRDSVDSLLTNAIIDAYGKCSSMADACTVFDSLVKPDVVSWTILVACYARGGNSAEALQTYENMRLADVEPNGLTFLSLLSACSHAGLVLRGVEYFESMTRDHNISPGIEHYVSMVDLLGRSGFFAGIMDLISAMPMEPTVVLWYCLLGACRKHGYVTLGKLAFDRALLLEPTHAGAYILMARIYSEAGLWDCARSVSNLRRKVGASKRAGQSSIQHDQGVHSFVVGERKCPSCRTVQHFLGEVDWNLRQDSEFLG